MIRTNRLASVTRTRRRALALLAPMALVAAVPAAGQQFEPGAYTPAPVGVNVLVLSSTLKGGDLTFAPSLPIEDAEATIGATVVGYVRSLGLWGRSANISVGLPYLLGNLQGLYLNEFQKIHRPGLGDLQARFSLNLAGARQSLRIAYSRGAYTTIGADFQSLGVSYTYAWRGRP